jgi:hypothetical protein
MPVVKLADLRVKNFSPLTLATPSPAPVHSAIVAALNGMQTFTDKQLAHRRVKVRIETINSIMNSLSRFEIHKDFHKSMHMMIYSTLQNYNKKIAEIDADERISQMVSKLKSFL